MMFDKLCRLAERHLPDYIPMLSDCKLFKFEGIPHDVLTVLFAGKTDGEVDDICKNFFLPFRNTAIEDGGSCIVLNDLNDDEIGSDKIRTFTEIMSFNADTKYFNLHGAKLYRELAARTHNLDDKIIVTVGYAKIVNWNRDNYHAVGNVMDMILADRNGLIINNLHQKLGIDFVRDNSLRNVAAAFCEIMFANQPDKFILQRKNVKAARKIKNKNRIARSHQRPLYTILHPAQIRKKMGISHNAGKSTQKTPHERRRHTRYLSDARYCRDENKDPLPFKTIESGPRAGEKYYKKVVVPATWIGVSEKRVGNKIYKVILDR